MQPKYLWEGEMHIKQCLQNLQNKAMAQRRRSESTGRDTSLKNRKAERP